MRLPWKPIWRFIVLALATASLVIGAAATLGVQTRSGEWVEITGEQDDMVFAAGANIKLSLTTPDDVFAVAGDIEASAVTADHLSLAGGDVTMDSLAVNDVVALGADILITSGQIEDDLLAAAADLSLGKALGIGGSAIVSGADLSIESPIGGELRATGEAVSINSAVGGDILVRANRLRIGPNARIDGDLRHRAQEITIDEAAMFAGEIIVLPPQAGPQLEPAMRRAAVMLSLFGVLLVFGLLVLVLAAVAALPAIMNRSRSMLSDRPLPALGIGFLITVIGPALIGLLFATVFGIPLALLIAALFAALAPLAIAGAAYWLGLRARQAVGAGKMRDPPGLGGRLVWTALGSLVLMVAAIIPIFGGIASLLALVIGLGAVGTQIWLALSGERPAAISE